MKSAMMTALAVAYCFISLPQAVAEVRVVSDPERATVKCPGDFKLQVTGSNNAAHCWAHRAGYLAPTQTGTLTGTPAATFNEVALKCIHPFQAVTSAQGGTCRKPAGAGKFKFVAPNTVTPEWDVQVFQNTVKCGSGYSLKRTTISDKLFCMHPSIRAVFTKPQ